MKKAALRFLGLLVLIVCARGAETASDWAMVPEILTRIQAPNFPAKDFSILDYGAKPGGQIDATDAIRQAIAACNTAGGGRVVVPPGIFLTGPIHLRSNVNLHVSEGATLQFKTDPAAYLPVVFTRWEGTECMNYSPLIYAFEQQNIALTGKGTLDGGASDANWWEWVKPRADKTTRTTADAVALTDLANRAVPVDQRVFGGGHFLRPNFFQPYRCRNVLVEDVSFRRSPMWEIHPTLCINVTVRGVNISSHGPNNDGCNPEASWDVLIEHCVFDTGDDCIAIKSGRNDDGRRVGVGSENIIVRQCEMKDGHGGVAVGSEIAGGCRNVFIEDCRMDSPNLERAMRFKSNARRGGIIENIFMRNVTIGRVAEAILTVDFMYEEGPNGPYRPVLRHVRIENVTSQTTPRVFFILGFPAATIDDIHLLNCTFHGADKSEIIQHAGHIEMENVMIEPASKVISLSTRAGPP